MATFILLNNVVFGTGRHYAGEIVDDAHHTPADFTSAGGVLVPTGDAAIDSAAAEARRIRSQGGDPGAMEAVLMAAFSKSNQEDAAAAQGDANAAVPLASVQSADVTLVGGTATENTLVYTASSRVIPIRNTAAGTPGDLSAGTITPGGSGVGSAVIDSASGTDTSTVTVLVIG